MGIRSLQLENFTAFEQVTFDFSPGINVLIGANSTGKTHVLKCLYALTKGIEEIHLQKISPDRVASKFSDKLLGVFKPDSVGRLIRRGRGRESARLQLECAEKSAGIEQKHAALALEITTLNRVVVQPGTLPQLVKSLYLPNRELLSISEGFVAAYQQRETAFDETYYDLSVALGASPLAGDRRDEIANLLTPLEKMIEGKAIHEQGRFYVRLPEGKLEAHLVSEGLLKLAGLVHLIRNGSLPPCGILFWDEPEANLNPKLVTVVVKTLQMLVAVGIQVFLTTHDYLLTQEISATLEVNSDSQVKYFSFVRSVKSSAVHIEESNSLVAIEHNPILEEYAAHYDREVERAQRFTRLSANGHKVG